MQEFDRSNTDELINVAQACRRIATHRATLQAQAIHKCGGLGGGFARPCPALPVAACAPPCPCHPPVIAAAVVMLTCCTWLPPSHRRAQQSCTSSPYIPTDPAAPALLQPWEWGEWLRMCKIGADVEAALSELGRAGAGWDACCTATGHTCPLQPTRCAAPAAPTHPLAPPLLLLFVQ